MTLIQTKIAICLFLISNLLFAQEKKDNLLLKPNEINIGINFFPSFYSNIRVIPDFGGYVVGYKRHFINSSIRLAIVTNYLLKSEIRWKEFIGFNLGYEGYVNLMHKKIQFLYGADVLVYFFEDEKDLINIAPLVGVRYNFNPKLSVSIEILSLFLDLRYYLPTLGVNSFLGLFLHYSFGNKPKNN